MALGFRLLARKRNNSGEVSLTSPVSVGGGFKEGSFQSAMFFSAAWRPPLLDVYESNPCPFGQRYLLCLFRFQTEVDNAVG